MRGAGGSRSYEPWSTTRGTACLTWMCVQAVQRARPACLGPQGLAKTTPPFQRRSRPLLNHAIEHALPRPGLADLRLDRYARPCDLGAVEHRVYSVDHGLLESCLY